MAKTWNSLNGQLWIKHLTARASESLSMPKLPQFTGAEVIRRLKRLGFAEDGSEGGHIALRHPETRATTSVPCHGSRPVKKGTLSHILKQCGVGIQQFIDA